MSIYLYLLCRVTWLLQKCVVNKKETNRSIRKVLSFRKFVRGIYFFNSIDFVGRVLESTEIIKPASAFSRLANQYLSKKFSTSFANNEKLCLSISEYEHRRTRSFFRLY